MSRRIRFLATLFALVGVLFAQLAVAAYTCPMPWSEAQALEQPMAPQAMDPQGCCGKAVADGEEGLCQAHCHQGNQSLDKRATPHLDPWAWTVALSFPARLTAVAAPLPSDLQPVLLARDTAPSIAVRHCRLRF